MQARRLAESEREKRLRSGANGLVPAVGDVWGVRMSPPCLCGPTLGLRFLVQELLDAPLVLRLGEDEARVRGVGGYECTDPWSSDTDAVDELA